MSLHIKNSSNAKLALIMAAALFLIWLVQPTVSEWLDQGQNSVPIQKTEQNPNPTDPNQAATPTVPALMPGADPFKSHIEKNGLAPNLAPVQSSNSQNNAASATHVCFTGFCPTNASCSFLPPTTSPAALRHCYPASIPASSTRCACTPPSPALLAFIYTA